MRLFIALPLNSEVQKELNSFIRALKRVSGDSIRWVDSANIHLTLKFLGEVEQTRFKQLSQEIGRIAADSPSFEFTVCGSGVFPGWNRPRILWTGVQAPAELGSLVEKIELATRALDFPPEERNFSPHLTLGRTNVWLTPAQREAVHTMLDQAKNRSFGLVSAKQIILFQSVLHPSGPVYTPAGICNLSTATE